MAEEFDVLIIGSGAAGFGAGMYAGIYKLKAMIFGKDFGLTALASWVEDYPGIDRIEGLKLVQVMRAQMDKFGIPVQNSIVEKVSKKNGKFEVQTDDGKKYLGKYVILATGETHKSLGIPLEEKFNGKGVSYCATCDAVFFKNKIVGIVGGGDAAAQAALILAEHASKVFVFVRKEKMRAQPWMVEKVEAHPKVEVLYNTEAKELKGEKVLQKVVVEQKGKRKELELQGLFVMVGVQPQFELAKQLGVELDELCFVKVSQKQETNVENVFAIGDLTSTHRGFKQIVVACAEGAIAARQIFERLKLR
ncbi:MAG: FAD-dependent oxidoreductase [Candidatus Diapherotrites archaeon]